MKTAKELQDMSSDSLADELKQKLKEQFSLRMQQGSGQEVRPHQFKAVRRYIARIKTVMTQQQEKVS